MNHLRRIAAHLLWRPEGLLRQPVVTLSAEGAIVRIGQAESSAERDRLAGTAFYAGLLVPDFPRDYARVFAAWMAREGGCASLAELLPQAVPAPDGCWVVISGIDYAGLRLTPQAQIRRVECGFS